MPRLNLPPPLHVELMPHETFEEVINAAAKHAIALLAETQKLLVATQPELEFSSARFPNLCVAADQEGKKPEALMGELFSYTAKAYATYRLGKLQELGVGHLAGTAFDNPQYFFETTLGYFQSYFGEILGGRMFSDLSAGVDDYLQERFPGQYKERVPSAPQL